MRSLRPVLVIAALAALALLPTSAWAISRPVPTAPAVGASSPFVPALSWKRVAAAARYELQVSSDATFQSLVVGNASPVSTRNTNATVATALPTGNYWWRVRAVSATGAASAYTVGRLFKIVWAATTLVKPTEGQVIAAPQPLFLDWQPTAGATSYRVYLAADSELATSINGFPVDTRGDELVVPRHLPTTGGGGDKRYWWAIAPIDSEGHVGARSAIHSFVRHWDTATVPSVTDLSPEKELFTPALSWTAVPGAVEYAIQIAPDPDFPAASIVCCDDTSVSTRYVPTQLLPNNRYYWRVAPLDPAGNRGAWSDGPAFDKAFDLPDAEEPGDTTIENLHLRDSYTDPATDADPGTDGMQTANPVVVWDRVPGAAGYYVELAPYSGTTCDWSGWIVRARTATNAFTPLGPALSAPVPYPAGEAQVARGSGSGDVVDTGKYCFRVRAWQGLSSVNNHVYSSFTYLGGDPESWGFQYTQSTAGDAACTGGYRLCASGYVAPQSGSQNEHAPLLVWKPVAGAQSYWVIIAKDPEFTTIQDYAFTNIPAYAPRDGGISEDQVKTYPDEDTSYYWAVLPSTSWTGEGAAGQPLVDYSSSFLKRTTPPSVIAGTGTSTGAPTFTWSSIIGAASYTLELRMPDGTTERIDTHAPSYTSFRNYPNDSALSWRVRANDAEPRALRWSATTNIGISLPVPVRSPSNPSEGDNITTFRWSATQGAIGYLFEAVEADGDEAGWDTSVAATTPLRWTGAGRVKWRAKAVYRSVNGGTVESAATSWGSYAKRMAAPTGAAVTRPNGGLLFSWQPKAGAHKYRVQVARDPAFTTTPIEDTQTAASVWAPDMTGQSYIDGGALYFRVALNDEDGNIGAWTTPVKATLPTALRITIAGYASTAERRGIEVTVTNINGKPVRGAVVVAQGPGVSAKAVRTSRQGKATIKVKARRGNVKFYIRATKKGFAPAIAESIVI